MRAKMWPKGYAPNPTGFSGVYREVQRLCREASPQSVTEIIRLRDQSDDDRVRLTAATWLVERGFGKAPPYDPSKERPQLNFNINDYSSEQLAIIEKATEIIKQMRDEKAAQGERIDE